MVLRSLVTDTSSPTIRHEDIPTNRPSAPASKKDTERAKTYNNGHSPVVTGPTTTPSLTGLSMGERTGSRVFQWVWSYVTAEEGGGAHEGIVVKVGHMGTESGSRSSAPCSLSVRNNVSPAYRADL
ncbi:hypothetical protein CCHR01_13855 [Colletotrichum chrysophilum]|uniref:Uncharacterized protein n=1 Tax=Colletotrichum chrysophilum TaxID=1836956 RepID=A0AAD9EA39_9PEZI|nr:hypothetical protein CCHR01_13855 [Colletotrichum chrysophilum]